jgi:hypothetical protein
MKNFFKRKNKHEPRLLVDRKVTWPNGIAVRTPDHIWYLKNGKRMLIFSERVLQSWNFYLGHGTDASVSHFPRAGVIGFRDGTLIRDVSDGKMYLIEGSKKRHITSPDVLVLLDWPVIDVSKLEAEIHPQGDELNAL